MLKFWQMLMLYFRLGVVEGEDPPADDPPADDPPADDPPADDPPADDLSSLLEDDTLSPADPPNRENAAIRDARKRAQDADEARIRAEATLEAERRMRQPAQPNAAQQTWDAEEAKLRSTETSDLEKWQITSNRTIRATQQAANQAIAQANDMRDQATFSQILSKAPAKFAERYSKKVEDAVAGMRSRGEAIPPRRAILEFIVGQDQTNALLSGKPKAKPADAPARTVDRGRPTGARSDVNGKGKPSRRDNFLRQHGDTPI